MPKDLKQARLKDMQDQQLSRRLSYLLRHAPHEAGVSLATGGWAPLDPILSFLQVSRAQVEKVVAENNKQRFSLSGPFIRANQGHSVEVDLQLEVQTPPDFLYHGTHAAALAIIKETGLKSMQRHHVHLSADKTTAHAVGARRGKSIILTVNAGKLYGLGIPFYLSTNGVWLVDAVPSEFIVFSDLKASI